jgi:hypothetical protein
MICRFRLKAFNRYETLKTSLRSKENTPLIIPNTMIMDFALWLMIKPA